MYENILNRDSLINKAIKECLNEMYIKSQPSISFYDIIEKSKNGEISKDDIIYERHYLSNEEYEYILNKYIEAYGFEPVWREYVDVVKEYLEKGGNKDKYVKERKDKNGNYHPGYRSYAKVPPLKKQIYKIIYGEYDGNGEIAEEVTNKIVNKVFELISNCQNYYRFGTHDYSKFTFNVSNYGPCTNKDTVKKYWESKGVHFEFEDRTTDPDELWEIDNYGHILEEDEQ